MNIGQVFKCLLVGPIRIKILHYKVNILKLTPEFAPKYLSVVFYIQNVLREKTEDTASLITLF